MGAENSNRCRCVLVIRHNSQQVFVRSPEIRAIVEGFANISAAFTSPDSRTKMDDNYRYASFALGIPIAHKTQSGVKSWGMGENRENFPKGVHNYLVNYTPH